MYRFFKTVYIVLPYFVAIALLYVLVGVTVLKLFAIVLMYQKVTYFLRTTFIVTVVVIQYFKTVRG